MAASSFTDGIFHSMSRIQKRIEQATCRQECLGRVTERPALREPHWQCELAASSKPTGLASGWHAGDKVSADSFERGKQRTFGWEETLGFLK